MISKEKVALKGREKEASANAGGELAFKLSFPYFQPLPNIGNKYLKCFLKHLNSNQLLNIFASSLLNIWKFSLDRGNAGNRSRNPDCDDGIGKSHHHQSLDHTIAI